MTEPRRFIHTTSLSDRLKISDRLKAFADELRAKTRKLRPGAEKDDLLKRARQADTASHIDDWVNSPGLQPPK